MYQLKGKPITQRVTKKLATEFTEMDPAPRDRPLSERRLSVYRSLWSKGLFRPCTWARAHCTETGGLYRVNGKHTSTLLAGLPEIPEFYVTVEDYQCDTLEDVAQLYGTFDSRLQSRTASDINLCFAGTIPELAGLSRNTINLVVGGVNYHLDGAGTAQAKQLAERAEVLVECPEFAVWLAGLFSPPLGENGSGGRHSCKHLQRSSVVAAMFACWDKAKGPATLFWEAVRDETGSTPVAPDRKLAHYLLTTFVNLGSGAGRPRKADGREIYAKCLHAWNAWRKGEKTDLRYYAEAPVPAAR
jgi:hypothetical protein